MMGIAVPKRTLTLHVGSKFPGLYFSVKTTISYDPILNGRHRSD